MGLYNFFIFFVVFLFFFNIMWKIFPHCGIWGNPNLESSIELTLAILRCYLEHGPSLSLKDLCTKAGTSEAKARYILSILERRGYLRKAEGTDEYVLSKGIVMLV